METIIVSCTLQEIGETQQTPPLALFLRDQDFGSCTERPG